MVPYRRFGMAFARRGRGRVALRRRSVFFPSLVIFSSFSFTLIVFGVFALSAGSGLRVAVAHSVCSSCLLEASALVSVISEYDRKREKARASAGDLGDPLGGEEGNVMMGSRRRMMHGRSELEIRDILGDLKSDLINTHEEQLETFIYEHGAGNIKGKELTRLLCVTLNQACTDDEIGIHEEL